MSGFICPTCGERSEPYQTGGGEKLAKTMNVEFLGKIPLDKSISVSTEEGDPFVHKFPDIEASKTLMNIIDRIEEKIGWGK